MMKTRYTPFLILTLNFACASEPPTAEVEEIANDRQAVMSPLDKRKIPIRAIAVVDDGCASRSAPLCGTSCDGSGGEPDDTRLLQGIATANQVYESAGVEFYVRSFERVQAPSLWCFNGAAQTWGNVKSAIRDAFPEIPVNAWPDATQKGTVAPGATFASDWWHAAAATYAPADEIVMLIARDSAGDFPHVGRVVMVAPWNLIGNTVGHELGHYLGLAHTYQTANGDDPVTDVTWKRSDRFDLMFRPTATGPEFFQSKGAAASHENELQLIRPSCTFLPGSCDMTCTLDGEVFIPGDAELDGVARMYLGGAVGVNIMDNPPAGCQRHLVTSQADMIWSFFNYEPPVTTQFAERVGTLPTGFSSQQLAPSRSRIGLVRGIWSAQRNFCRAADEHLYIGDFNGDLRDDLLCNQDDGDMFVDLADSSGRFLGSDWSQTARNFCQAADEHLYIGDFDGDLHDDLLCNQDDGDMFVDLADSSGRFMGSDWSQASRNFCRAADEHLYIGDFDGDLRDDLLCNQDDGDMFVDLADSSGRFLGSDWSQASRNFCRSAGEHLYIGDFDGNLHDDLLCNQDDGDMLVDLADSSGRFLGSDWSTQRDLCTGASSRIYVGDVNADGRADLVCRDLATGMTDVDLANTNGQFWSSEWRGHIDGFCSGASVKDALVGNVDGDFGVDIVCNSSGGTLSVASLRAD
ncbi:hypothetical protein WME91_50060 [Sorangium sp. So ce269]